MALSKKHIQYIDSYLKEQGVNFWDIRIELIDHVASKLEENQDIILNRTFLIKEFGTRITLDKLVFDKEKSIRKKYKKLYFKEMIHLIKSPLKVLLIMLFVFSYYYILSEFSVEIFNYTSLVILILPISILMILSFRMFKKKNKSVHIEGAKIFIFSSIIILQFINIRTNSSFNHKLIIYVLVSLNAVWFYIGFKIYIKASKKYTKIFKHLLAI